MLKAGQKVRNITGFFEGVGIIVSIDGNPRLPCKVEDCQRRTWWLNEDELEALEEPEVTEPTQQDCKCVLDECMENPDKVSNPHYQTTIQPLETMQANMSPEAFQGYCRGNIIKYACRLGKKDEPIKEAKKLLDYAKWLVDSLEGTIIDPREEK